MDDYRRAGVKLIWVVNPEQQSVQVYTSRGLELELSTKDEITGGDVLPQFRCQVAEFFPPLASPISPLHTT